MYTQVAQVGKIRGGKPVLPPDRFPNRSRPVRGLGGSRVARVAGRGRGSAEAPEPEHYTNCAITCNGSRKKCRDRDAG